MEIYLYYIYSLIECVEILIYDYIKTDTTHNKGIKWNIFKKLHEFKQLMSEEFILFFHTFIDHIQFVNLFFLNQLT